MPNPARYGEVLVADLVVKGVKVNKGGIFAALDCTCGAHFADVDVNGVRYIECNWCGKVGRVKL